MNNTKQSEFLQVGSCLEKVNNAIQHLKASSNKLAQAQNLELIFKQQMKKKVKKRTNHTWSEVDL